MTEISFHFNAADKAAYACRVARKVLRRNRRLVIQAPEPLLTALDELLWNMAPQDFVAHCRTSAPLEQWNVSPVVLTCNAEDWPHRDILLNLHECVPEGFGSFAELIEIVSADDAADRDAARSRWRYYRERGYALVRHDLVARSA